MDGDDLLAMAEEISHLREKLLSRDNKLRHQAEEIEQLRKKAGQRGARMQMMADHIRKVCWYGFEKSHPEVASWFDADGVPK